MGNAHDHEEVFHALGVDLDNLGCVMLDLESVPVTDVLGTDLAKSLFWHDDPNKWWIKGPVGDHGAHVTLLYGLLRGFYGSGSRRGMDYYEAIEHVLAGWEMPEVVQLGQVHAWTPPDNGPYRTIVAEVHKSVAVMDAHQRLSYLPHVDTFPEYTPHVTLAYVRAEAADEALTTLRWELPKLVGTARLNYGRR